MFLKSLDINGFKSFADKTHIEFSDGITSLLGPNGCGKSNIVDSIKWVLGEQSTKTLRAGKMEDVIFNGNDKRKPLQFAEVTLTIDNSEHNLPSDVTEIEIKRRIFRSGESEYYLNRTRCLLKNIRELFFDTGVGKSAYSILEQGKIDQILSSKPEDRRYIFEEAAGISRFKVECNEAQRKIERTDDNITQFESLIKVEKRSYDSLKAQAEKARSYNDLVKRQLDLDTNVYLLKLQTNLYAKDIRQNKVESITKQLENIKSKFETFQADIEKEQEELRFKSSESYKLQSEINRTEETVNSKNDRIGLLEDRYRDFLNAKTEAQNRAEGILSSLNQDKVKLEELENSLEERTEKLEEIENQIAHTLKMIDNNLNIIKTKDEEVESLEQSNLDLDNNLLLLSQRLKQVVEQLVGELDEKMSPEFSPENRKLQKEATLSVLASLQQKLQEYKAFFSQLPETEGMREEVLKRLDKISTNLETILSSFVSYSQTIPSFIDTLLEPKGLLTQKRGIEIEETETRGTIESNRAKIIEAKNLSQSLMQEAEGLKSTVENMRIQRSELTSSIEFAKTLARNTQNSINEKELNYSDAISAVNVSDSRISETSMQLKEADEEKLALIAKISELKHSLSTILDDLKIQNTNLSEKQKEKNDAVELFNSLSRELDQQKMWLENIDTQTAELYTQYFNTYSRSLKEYESRLTNNELPEQILVENELKEVKKQLQALGPNINHMAEDDFKETKERYDFYNSQLNDLLKAKADLVKVLEDIQDKSKELFIKTYKEISNNFQDMFKRLFGGGKAEVILQDPENVLESGIDIFAQPPGKKLISLSLLSGGERSMTAVALLFATYLVKPSPFCILDEIDAALDDKNIGYFLAVLEDFAKTSQFIIITHNKHTVLGSASLLGVTQMEAGVSTTVSYKLSRIAGEAVILNDENKEVDFDESGRLK